MTYFTVYLNSSRTNTGLNNNIMLFYKWNISDRLRVSLENEAVATHND